MSLIHKITKSLSMTLSYCWSIGHVMSPHHSDHLSEKSQASWKNLKCSENHAELPFKICINIAKAIIMQIQQIKSFFRQFYQKCKKFTISSFILFIECFCLCPCLLVGHVYYGVLQGEGCSWSIAKGRIPLSNGMNVWKNSKQPLTPPSHFRKIRLQFFSVR